MFRENTPISTVSSSTTIQSELEKVMCDLEKEIENTFNQCQRLENKLSIILMPQSPTKEIPQEIDKQNSELTEAIQQKIIRLEAINRMLMVLFERLVV